MIALKPLQACLIALATPAALLVTPVEAVPRKGRPPSGSNTSGLGTAGLLIAPSAGSLTDRFGAKRILIIAFILISAGSLFTASSNTVNSLLIGMLILRIGQIASSVTGYTLLTKIAANERQQALFISAWGVASNIGYILFPPLGGWVVVHSERGWTSISLFWLVSVLALLLFSLLAIKETTTQKTKEHQRIEWSWPITGGIIFSLTSAIPVIDVLNPRATGAGN